jgi:hypothetical protein
MDGKIDSAFQATINEWQTQNPNFKIVPKAQPIAIDTTILTQWHESMKQIMQSMKEIFGDKDTWGYFGALLIYSIGTSNITVAQQTEIDAIKVILAKDPMTFTDLGEIQGRLIHLVTPELRGIIGAQFPGLLSILDILSKLGGIVI